MPVMQLSPVAQSTRSTIPRGTPASASSVAPERHPFGKFGEFVQSSQFQKVLRETRNFGVRECALKGSEAPLEPLSEFPAVPLVGRGCNVTLWFRPPRTLYSEARPNSALKCPQAPARIVSELPGPQRNPVAQSARNTLPCRGP